MVQNTEAVGDAIVRQTHFRTSPVRLQEDSGRIIGASGKIERKQFLTDSQIYTEQRYIQAYTFQQNSFLLK